MIPILNMATPPMPVSSSPAAETLVTLAQLPPNVPARVVDLSAPVEDEVRLKSLGVCVGRRVEAIKAGDPLVVRVLGGRIGLSARLAAGVVVRPE